MTYLLKPNDNGLASLDEVKAWMEAQNALHDKKAQLQKKQTQPSADGFFLTRHAETERYYSEWLEALKGTDEKIATLPEIYRGLKEQKGFARQLRNDLLHHTVLTGTTCEIVSVGNEMMASFYHRDSENYLYNCTHTRTEPDTRPMLYSMVLHTTDGPGRIGQSFKNIADRISVGPLRPGEGPLEINTGAFPLDLRLSCTPEDPESYLFISAGEMRGRIYTIKEDKSGKRP